MTTEKQRVTEVQATDFLQLVNAAQQSLGAAQCALQVLANSANGVEPCEVVYARACEVHESLDKLLQVLGDEVEYELNGILGALYQTEPEGV